MKTICKKIPLKEIATFLNGYAFKPNDWSKEGLPIIRIQNLTGTNKEFNYYNGKYNEKYIIENGDILISWSASLGIFLWENMRGILNQHIFKVIFDKNIEINKTYFLHCMKYLIKKMEKNIHGSTMKHITRPEFEKINFPIYEIDIQRKISKNLIFIAKIIENNKKLLDELVELCKSLFTTMFGDIKTNDKNWKIYKFGDKLNISSGGTPLKTNKSYWENGTIPWIGSNLCANKTILKNDGKFITKEGLKNSSAKIYKENTIIVALIGATIGKTGLLKFQTATNQNIAALEIINNDYSPEFLFFLVQNLYYKFSELGGNTFKMANLSFIKNLPLVSPPIELQNKFAEKIEKIEKLKFEIEKSIEIAQNLYDSLISKYFDN